MSENPKYVDLLDEDKQIAGQKYCCLSFLSPEKILKQKKIFYFGKFLKDFEFENSIKKFTQFLNFISYKHKLKFDDIVNDLNDFLKSEKDKMLFDTLENQYKTFLDHNEESLLTEFNSLNDCQTNVRGIKVRGCFETQAEAQLRARLLREVDSHHDIYVAQVGMWLPFDPDAYKTGKVDYMEGELNKLMAEKMKQDALAKKQFQTRIKETRRRAIEDNIEKAAASGNKLTQTINEDGELVDIGTNTVVQSFGTRGITTSEQIRKELFENENIRTKASDKNIKI